MDKKEGLNENENKIEEMISNYENTEHLNENNNKLRKLNEKTSDININMCFDENIDKQLMSNKDNIDNNCKVCFNNDMNRNTCEECEDISNEFFASGPFYAIADSQHIQDMEDENHSNTHSLHTKSLQAMAGREGSSKCNVVYAEMAQLSELPDMTDLTDLTDCRSNDKSTHNKSSDESSLCCALEESHSSSSGHLVVDSSYQLLYYNYCGSPLSHCNSQLSDDFYYLSSDESKAAIFGQMDDKQRSTHSSPIMLKLFREQMNDINHNLNKDNSKSCCYPNERSSNYTTVIKPKAVRPQLSLNNSMECNGNTSPNNIMSCSNASLHGSSHALTDRDESAFRQIPRRRSNSEATHHYHSLTTDRNQMPFTTTFDTSRPLLTPERSRSVNKSYHFDESLDFRKCRTISDKQILKTDSNNRNSIYSNGKIPDISNDYMETTAQKRTPNEHKSEPIHMTLEEVRNIFTKNEYKRCKNTFMTNKSFADKHKATINELEDNSLFCKSKSKSKIKCAFESLFRTKRKSDSPISSIHQNIVQSKATDRVSTVDSSETNSSTNKINGSAYETSSSPFTNRALPPLPKNKEEFQTLSLNREVEEYERQKFLDYAASIERVKDCGWYWGPISGEMAEKLLATEPCGSFIVRDSSDEHYIFSLTFKLNGLVRHVRIEHDQGNFSFGSLQKFRSNTIVDFIENAVEHSRSGRFLFFLHRRPVVGPLRVQLLHPLSRFKQIQSLQHMCRFVILKHVRRDLIEELPLPKMLKSYLNTPYYYSEELAIMNRNQDNNQSLPLNTSQ